LFRNQNLGFFLIMPIKIKKKPNENAGALVRRFSQQIHKSGILNEVKSRQHRTKPVSKRYARKSAILRAEGRKKYSRLKRIGKA
jgi:ribosomal protein S21